MLDFMNYSVCMGVFERCVTENLVHNRLNSSDEYLLISTILEDFLEHLMHESRMVCVGDEEVDIIDDIEPGYINRDDCRSAYWQIPPDLAAEALSKIRLFAGAYNLFTNNISDIVAAGNIAMIIYREGHLDESGRAKYCRKQLSFAMRLAMLVSDWVDTDIAELRSCLYGMALMAENLAASLVDFAEISSTECLSSEEIQIAEHVFGISSEFRNQLTPF